MKIWIYLNGIQQGPYTFDQIKLLPLQPDTPVWYEGLPKWCPASEAPVTAVLFAPPANPTDTPLENGQPFEHHEDGYSQRGTQPFAHQPYMQQAYTQQQYGQPSDAEPPKRPSTYMAWCIILTIVCCCPFALAGIITGAISSSRYNSGDNAGAKRMSAATEWLLIISIVWAIIYMPVVWAFGL